MRHTDMDATEILARYQAGERQFVGLSCQEAELLQLELPGVNLSQTDLRQSRLGLTNLRGATLQKVDLSEALLWGHRLYRLPIYRGRYCEKRT